MLNKIFILSSREHKQSKEKEKKVLCFRVYRLNYKTYLLCVEGRIENVLRNDLCFPFSIQQSGHLDVVVPPDILNSPEISADESVTNEGGNVQLMCQATGVPEPRSVATSCTITWSFNLFHFPFHSFIATWKLMTFSVSRSFRLSQRAVETRRWKRYCNSQRGQGQTT